MIVQCIGKVRFPIGYCERWTSLDEHFFITAPFVKGSIRLPKGTFNYRGDWTRNRMLSLTNHDFLIAADEPWMHIELPEALDAIALCTEASSPLPREGFSRIHEL